MAGFDSQDGGQSLGDKAAQTAGQVGDHLKHFGQHLWHKTQEVATSPQVSLAGHATKDALLKVRDAVGLQQLDLSHNPLLSDRDLVGVASGLQQLTHLDLGFNPKITDQGVSSALHGNRNLQHLNLENTLITGATLAFLPHAALISLVLRNDRNLNINALGNLTHMQNLQRVDLSGNRQITDAALPELKRLTQVKDLDLRMTGLSAHAIAELKHALPHTQIRN